MIKLLSITFACLFLISQVGASNGSNMSEYYLALSNDNFTGSGYDRCVDKSSAMTAFLFRKINIDGEFKSDIQVFPVGISCDEYDKLLNQNVMIRIPFEELQDKGGEELEYVFIVDGSSNIKDPKLDKMILKHKKSPNKNNELEASINIYNKIISKDEDDIDKQLNAISGIVSESVEKLIRESISIAKDKSASEKESHQSISSTIELHFKKLAISDESTLKMTIQSQLKEKYRTMLALALSQNNTQQIKNMMQALLYDRNLRVP